MLLSVKQYAILFVLFIVILVSIFSYHISSNIENTRNKIDASQRVSAKTELEHSIILTLENIKQSANKLSHWEEVRQQIETPEIFAYWYNVRFKKYAFDLQEHTLDLMIYDINGKALARLGDSTLPYEIQTENIDSTSFQIASSNNILYISPVYIDEKKQSVIGYLGARIQFLPLLKSLSNFQFIEFGTLRLHTDKIGQLFNTFSTAQFSYDLHKSEGMIELEMQIQESITELVFIIIVSTILLYVALVFIVGIPMKDLTGYINRLRTKPETIDKHNYHGLFQVSELKTIYDSLTQYHTELSQNKEHLSLTLNSIGDAVITTDSENNILRMNPVAESLTGWSFDEAKGLPLKQIFNVVDSSNKKSVNIDFDKIIESGETFHLGKHSILISKDKTEYFIADSAAPIRDSSGKIHGIVLVFNDITEQRMKDEQLQHSLKMDALGKLTGGIAHDFNNLLGVILGYSELLISQDSKKQSKTHDYAKNIYSAGERARKLTSQLLTFSHKHTPEAAVTDINQLITSEQHMLEKILTARIELTLDLDDTLWPVYIDENLLQDAILNMSINSMHAMPDGGKLILKTQNQNLDSSYKQHLDLPTGDYIHLLITDTGIGMDRETCHKIFDPFFTTKGEQGTGLGMSQVYGFVKQSGGAVHAYSEPGTGTHISIYLPRYQYPDNLTEDLPGTKAQSTSIQGGRETILVVDDEPALLELSCQMLANHGYHILNASNGNEALNRLQNNTVDLLLTDVIMPKMDGYQLAAIAVKKYPKIKIQIMSGYSSDREECEEDKQLSKKLLHKPFTSEDLLKRVRKTLDE